MIEARRFVVTGRVQGVGFRYFAQRQATSLGLAGWVRNLPGGRTVEAVAEGAPAALDALAAALREGPSGGFVSHLEAYPQPPEHLTGFEIRHES